MWNMVKRLKYNYEPTTNPSLSDKDWQVLFFDRIALVN
jgi:hypothetical protein